jgi:hypothetical protein
MYSHNTVKHFVLTLEKGKILISRAREIVPNRSYEIIYTPKPLAFLQWNLPDSWISFQDPVLKEPMKKKESPV